MSRETVFQFALCSTIIAAVTASCSFIGWRYADTSTVTFLVFEAVAGAFAFGAGAGWGSFRRIVRAEQVRSELESLRRGEQG